MKESGGGIVQNIYGTALLLGKLLQRVRRFAVIKSRVLVCAPSDASQDERSALVEAVWRSGASAVRVIPEPLASAIGAGLHLSLPFAQMVIGIGHGVTDIAVIRSRQLVLARALRRGCADLRSAVQRVVAEKSGLFLFLRRG